MGLASRSPVLVLLGLLLLAISIACGSPDGGSVLCLPSSTAKGLADGPQRGRSHGGCIEGTEDTWEETGTEPSVSPKKASEGS